MASTGLRLRRHQLAPWAPALLLALLAPLSPRAEAQFSPNCERNGRRESCAYTPLPGGPPEMERGVLVFADHTMIEVQRNAASCRQKGPVITCDARILMPPGHEEMVRPAFYRGTAYEGGYRHEYGSRGLRLVFSYLD
jgi:hypothetical protein